MNSFTNKYLFIILFTLVSCRFAVAQNNITGKVTNAKDGSGLIGATVYIPDVKIGAISKVDGSYQISDVPNGSYIVVVIYVGYSAQSKQINVKGSVTLDFSLDQSATVTEPIVITGVSEATDLSKSPQQVTE